MTSLKKLLSISVLLIAFFSIFHASAQNNTALIKYVNPIIGTQKMGHTFPGATVPFGMVQLSPDTRVEGWDACGGYHYSDSTILGFSHTHLSGTGIADYGDILLLPTDGRFIGRGMSSRFSHARESASPGYYSVVLDDFKITAELNGLVVSTPERQA